MSESPLLDIFLLVLLLGALAALARKSIPRYLAVVAPRRDGSYFALLARQAGFQPQRSFWPFWISKTALALGLPVLLLEILATPSPSLLLMLAVSIVGFFSPDALLYLRRRSRRRRITNALSYFLDLLVSLLRSGLGIEEAFRRAGRFGFSGQHPLAEEIHRVGEEITIGRDRGAAFQSLAERTGVPDLQAVASALQIGSRLGAPISETLAAQADLQREKRLENGKRRIARATIIALFPVFLCGYPMFVVLTFFPAGIELLETFRLLRALFIQ